jgi:pimeloyl-ACP methyl ester carboxylesterase
MLMAASPYLALTAVFAVGILAFIVYLTVKYSRIIGRIFEEIPVFQPMRAEPDGAGEHVRFHTEDGLELAGTYYATPSDRRLGTVVFCHEFLGNRHSVHHYADELLGSGFDIFTFDFRNHGDSQSEAGLEPIQWVSDRDRRDLQAALAYLRSRPDHDAAGVGLFGVSRGGGAALVVAAEDLTVWGVLTDGAFPTHGTVMAYILRWVEIYIRQPWLRAAMPMFMYRYVAWTALLRSRLRLRRKFPDVERAASRLTPRPWLSIHGERDTYIGPQIARALFDRGGEPKEFWLVPDAKHNRCCEVQPGEYRRRVISFFIAHAPRQAHEAALPGAAPAEVPAAGRKKRRRIAARASG